MEYVSLEASEDIENLTVGIVEDGKVRKIHSTCDLMFNVVVLVNNVKPYTEPDNKFMIQKGQQARCKRLPI